jgi:AcrR family transcriptional regulator
MDGFERRKKQSQDDIRSAAEELFAKFGADKVSINDIANKAGVSQATIYNNFGSKEALVHDYRKNMVANLAGKFRSILLLKKSFFDKSQGLLQSWIEFTERYNNAEEKPFDKKNDTAVKEAVDSAILEFIQAGKKSGNINIALSDAAIVNYIKLFQRGIAHDPEVRRKMQADKHFAADMVSMFIHGIAGNKT